MYIQPKNFFVQKLKKNLVMLAIAMIIHFKTVSLKAAYKAGQN